MPANEDISENRLAATHSLWERARRVMPGVCTATENGAAHGEFHPRFLVRGESSHVWDVDGNEYVAVLPLRALTTPA